MQGIQKVLFAQCFRVKRILLAVVLVFGALAATTMEAQQKPEVAGDYAGMLGPLHVKLHFKVDAAGTITGTLDSVDQGAIGIPCADFHLDGQTLTFTVPAVHGKWAGTVTADGLTGTWDQGSPQPLDLKRDTFVPAAKPSVVDGIWLGTLQAGSSTLRIQVVVKSDNKGQEYCAMDSLDQRVTNLECAKVVLQGDSFSFEVPVAKISWSGKLSADGKTLTGVLTQGTALTLNFNRQDAVLTVAPILPPTFDPAMAPVNAADLQAVLDKDIAEALKSGQLAPETGAGVSIGVVEHGVRRVFSYGVAKPDSMFEIGSITKTFTALMLSQMVEQGKVKLDEPVRDLLPAGTVAKPAGAEITLLDIATQHSGLPGMPDNFPSADSTNPYIDYHAANLYEYIAKHGVAKAGNPGFVYSNLGFGLLGQALAVRAGKTWPALLKEEVTGPLGLKDTVVSMTPEQQARFLPAHSGDHGPAHQWDFDAMAGAGAIRSTAGDILTYVEANLHPDGLKPAAESKAGSTLAAALTRQHELRADVGPGVRIALAWMFDTETGNYWHNGATGGYSAYAFFNPKQDYAAVVLLNTTVGPNGSFADRLGQHIGQRLAGKPAISLGN